MLSHMICVAMHTAAIAALPARNRYWMALFFHDISLKLNFSENMGSSLIIRILVVSDIAISMKASVLWMPSKNKLLLL